MLRFGLVLLLAASALAAPVDEVLIDVTRQPDGKSHIIDGAFARIDGGELSIYSATMHQVLNDISDLPDRASKAYAVGNALGTALAHATGLPGDSCISAQLIQAYTENNPASLRKALYNFIVHIAKNLRVIVNFIRNRESARYSVGSVSNCKGGGRSYRLEAAWEAIINNASPHSLGLITEQYCAAKRLYNAFDIRHNNIAAVITASSLPPVANIYRIAYPQLLNFIYALAGNGNLDKALAEAQDVLLRSTPRP